MRYQTCKIFLTDCKLRGAAWASSEPDHQGIFRRVASGREEPVEGLVEGLSHVRVVYADKSEAGRHWNWRLVRLSSLFDARDFFPVDWEAGHRIDVQEALSPRG